jgi:hypothetical protein
MQLTFSQCQQILGNRKTKKLSNNTYLRQESDNLFYVKFHDTDIICIHPDNTQVIDCNGFRTKTTKERVNEFSFARILQEKGIWYLPGKVEYFDGIRVAFNGEIVGNVSGCNEYNEKSKAWDKLVKEYIDGFCKDALQNGIGVPDKGDCLYCQMLASRQRDELGNVALTTFGVSHFCHHVIEKYYVPSFVGGIIIARGYPSPGFVWSLIDRDVKNGCDKELRDQLRWFFRVFKKDLVDAFCESDLAREG